MNKILIAPDSFKGSLTAIDICDIVKEEIHHIFPHCQVLSAPIADGGEGTVDSFLHAVGGKKVRAEVTGPYFEKISSYYGLIHHGKTAIIEMAAAAGLPLVNGRENPLKTTTYGVGELIQQAIAAGVENIILGLGGSATNDGGCGLAAALGVQFYNKDNQPFIPLGESLHEIVRIDTIPSQKIRSGISISAMCDVTNPLYGPHGAAHIFAPQKGADLKMVELLDRNLRDYGNLLDQLPLKERPSTLPGAGAAGGLGAGLYALLSIPLVSGIELLLDAIGFDNLLEDVDLVITGEGQVDGQSLKGKVVLGIAKYTQRKHIPVCVIAGQSLDQELEAAYDLGISGVFTINRQAVPFAESKPRSKDNLRYTVRNILSLLKDLKS